MSTWDGESPDMDSASTSSLDCNPDLDQLLNETGGGVLNNSVSSTHGFVTMTITLLLSHPLTQHDRQQVSGTSPPKICTSGK